MARKVPNNVAYMYLLEGDPKAKVENFVQTGGDAFSKYTIIHVYVESPQLIAEVAARANSEAKSEGKNRPYHLAWRSRMNVIKAAIGDSTIDYFLISN